MSSQKVGVPTFSAASKPARDMARFEQSFPNLYGLSNIILTSKNSENIKTARRELQAKLEDRTDLFSTVLAPGAGPYYDVNGLLYLSEEQVNAHVAYALALRPLFQAVVEQPTTESLATLVNQVSASIELGRDPQGLDDLFKEAAKSTVNLMKGVERPVDWTAVAGLNADPDPNEAHFVVVPRQGKNTAAATFIEAALAEIIPLNAQEPDKISVVKELGHRDDDTSTDVSSPPNVVPLVVIGAFLAAFVLFALVGQFSLAAMLASPAIVTLSVISALATFFLRDTAFTFWVVILSVSLCVLHFAARLTFASLEAFTAARTRTSALMLAAQKQGTVLMWLWPVMVAPWAGWAMIGDPAFAILTGIVAFSLFIGLVASLSLVPAIASLTPGAIQWVAAEWLMPIYQGLFTTTPWRRMVQALASLGIVAACAGFWFMPTLLSKTAQAPGNSETPVYVLAESLSDVDRILARLKTVPQAEKVQWLGTFLPNHFAEKQKSLASLKDEFSHTTPLQPQSAIILRDQIATLQESLRTISNSTNTRPALAAAATEFRQSLELLSATSNDTEIELFEKRMFGAFNVLPQRAEALAAISQPSIAALDPQLRSLFMSDQGLFRLTVSAKSSTPQTELAEKLADLGLAVVHPSLVSASKKFQAIRNSFIILAAGVGLGLIALAIGVQSFYRVIICAAASIITLGIAALFAVWRHETAEPLPLLILTITFSNMFALCATSSLKYPISNRAVPEAIHAAEAWVMPLLILAVAAPSLLLKAGTGTMAMIDLALLQCAATALCGVMLKPLAKNING